MAGRFYSGDQFRPFFPARVVPPSLDRLAREESQRRSSQSTFSYSQSQERTQTTGPALYGSSGQESQASLPRYDDMLGTERHQEIKERFAAVSNAISSLVQDINAIKKVTEDQGASLERLKVTITQIAEVQANQERQLNEILQMVKDIHSSQTAESAQRQKCEILSEGEDFCSQLSEDGISVSEYLSVRKLRVHESPNGKHFCKRCPLGLTYKTFAHHFRSASQALALRGILRNDAIQVTHQPQQRREHEQRQQNQERGSSPACQVRSCRHWFLYAFQYKRAPV